MARKKKNREPLIEETNVVDGIDNIELNNSEIDIQSLMADASSETETENRTETVTETETELSTAPEIEADPDAEGETVTETELLTLAQNEGLIDAIAENSEVEEADVEIDLPEAEQAQIMASLETILFMSDKPVGLSRLRQIIESERADGAHDGTSTKLAVYRQLMAKLRAEFSAEHRGIEIAEVSQGYQLRTKPHMSAVLRKMVKTQPMKLSGTNLEVLAIVSYKQPVTKDDIDQIRGVDSGYVLRTLMEKRLVKISGRSDLPGRPMLYGTTHEFLELFNLKDVTSLPPLHEVEAMVAASEVGAEEKMQDALLEFGNMVATDKKVLFDDSQLDEELEAIRNEIASIPTSTMFIDEQKAKEKLAVKVAELAAQGLMLDAEGKVVPIGSIATTTVFADAELAIQITAPTTTFGEEVPAHEHQPSADLLAEADAAQAERYAEIIEQTVVETEIAMVNAEALADAVGEAKAEQAEQELDAAESKSDLDL